MFWKSKKSVLRSKREKIFLAVTGIILLAWSLTIIYPFFWMLINSFKDFESFNSNTMNFPEKWHFENWITGYLNLWAMTPSGVKVEFFELILNSLWYTFIGAFLSLIPCVMFSYAIAKYEFRYKHFLYVFAVIIMMIPIYGSMPANVKIFNDWGLTDTPFFLIGAMGVIGGSTWLILTSFMESLPWSYAEATFIDGGGHTTVLLRIMLPMCTPILIALYVMNCIGRWNDYMTPYIYLPSYPTLATGLLVFGNSLNKPIYFVSMLISVIPIFIVYALFQNQIMNNVTIGGLKG